MTSRTARAKARLLRTTPPAGVKVLQDGAAIEFEMSGFKFSDFDRAGNISASSLVSHLESSRMLEFGNTDFFFNCGDENQIDVARSRIMEVRPLFYNIASINCPHLHRVEAHHLGNFSLVLRHSIYDKSSGELMAQMDRQVIFIDAATRKAVTVPHSIAKLFAAVSPTSKPTRIVLENAPETAITLDRRVLFSDFDLNYHMKSSAYTSWCLDAAADAVSSKKLRNFTEDIAEYRLKKMELFIMSEVFVNDIIVIKLWECDKTENTLLFRMVKKVYDKTRDVSFCRMTFYPLSFGWPSKL